MNIIVYQINPITITAPAPDLFRVSLIVGQQGPQGEPGDQGEPGPQGEPGESGGTGTTTEGSMDA